MCLVTDDEDARGETERTEALEADVWTRSGLFDGKGPWAALAQHPQGAELREAPVELCSDTLRRAVSAWCEANARRRAHRNGARG